MKRLISFCIVAVGAAALTMGGFVVAGEEGAEMRGGSAGDVMKLPAPKDAGKLSLEEVLRKRRSVRRFSGEDISLEGKAQLLWAAQGKTDPRGLRTAPSAGALYPLEVYLLDRKGAYKYISSSHSMKQVKSGDLRGKLAAAALRQDWIADGAAIIVIAAVFERTTGKYGGRAERYVYVEAGHAGQNVLLEAVALGLGATPVGAFSDKKVAELLSLPKDEEALYIIPVGVPR